MSEVVVKGQSGREWVIGPCLTWECREDACDPGPECDGNEMRLSDGTIIQRHWHCGQCNEAGVNRHLGHWRDNEFTCASKVSA